MKQTKRTAFIYIRVSTARQAADGVSLEAQEAKCRLYAQRMGWEVAEVFADEGISGRESVENRPGLARLLKATRANPDAVVVVYSISRLARRQKLLIHLLDERDGEGLAVSSITENFDTTTPMGRAIVGMISVFAELEAELASERTKDALAHVKSQGTKLGNPGIKALAPETVKLIKELYNSGLYTQRQIVDELNRRNIPTARGYGQWHLPAVQAAIKS